MADFPECVIERSIFKFVLITALCNASYVFCCANETRLPQSKGGIANTGTLDQYDLKEYAERFSKKLSKTAQVELGITTMQKIYDSFKFMSTKEDEQKILDKMSQKLEKKLTQIFNILENSKNIIETFALDNPNYLLASELYHFSQPMISPMWNLEDLKHDNGNRDNESHHLLSKVVTDHMNNSTKIEIGMKQLYFLSTSELNKDSVYSNPAFNDLNDIYMWRTYLQQTKPTRKQVIIAINHGNQFINTAKLFAKEMLSVLSDEDLVGVVGFTNDLSSPFINDYNCQTPNQSPIITDECRIVTASRRNKSIFIKFINSLPRRNVTTNHTAIFQQLFKTVEINSDVLYNENVMILYISNDIMSSSETKSVLELIAERQRNLDISIIINTVILHEDSNAPNVEDAYLYDVAVQDYDKYNIIVDSDIYDKYLPGISQYINTSYQFGFKIAKFLSTLNATWLLDSKRTISLPTLDDYSKEMFISMSVPCGKTGELGLVALDIYYSNLAEDVTYYSNHPKYSYAILLNTEGATLMHPSYPRPVMTYEQIKFFDISHLEKWQNSSTVREKITTDTSGNYTFQNGNETLKYVWNRISNTYIICIAVKDNKKQPARLQKIVFTDLSTRYNLLHHRLDLLPPPSLCRHLKQVATLDAGTLYLSASCFQSPFSYLRGSSGFSVSPLTLQSFMAYIKDNTRYLANPGLKPEVRNDVTVLSHILDYLMKQHLHGTLRKYIVRRYVATVNGVLQMYPGSILDIDLEPSRRNWFARAVEHPGKLVLTPPYLDAGGAGYIVTLSHTLYEGNVTGKHTEDDNIIAVIAMDVTFGYVYKMLLETMPFCTKPNIKCFVIDDRGYLIYHPSLLDPNGKGAVEQQHIIHKESLVANDLLNHKNFVRKILCNNYADSTIQRYYKFNMSIAKVLTNAVHSEHCVKYYITPIADTNVFVGVVNFTCDDVTTFCPCSTVDRLCLICNRVEQNECECPCECPLNLDGQVCPKMNKTLTNNQICLSVSEQTVSLTGHLLDGMTSILKPCLPFLCDVHLTYESCLGVLGCEWCRWDVDGETPLQHPFCTSLSTCFNGVLGSVSPYRDGHLGAMSSDDLFVSAYSSVGPVAGVLVALSFIVALVFYCYRQFYAQSVEHLYVNSAPDQVQGVRMSSIDVNEDFNEDLSTHQDKLLQKSSKEIGPVSPYCITTGYRKPITAVDSDHGYSTMTPHEESERLSFALIELDSLEDDINTSDTTSTNNSISAAKHKIHSSRAGAAAASSRNTDVPHTYLSKKHCMLAPVTVHRNMETL